MILRPVTPESRRDLALPVRPQERQVRTAALGEAAREPVRERDGEWHQLGCLVAGISEHHPLVAGPLLLVRARVDSHGDLGRLLLDGDEDRAALGVEPHRAVGVADALDGAAHEPRIVDGRAGGDLPDQDHEPGLHARLERDAARAVLADALVQHCVGDLVAHLVGVAFGDRFRAEQCVA